MTYHVVCRDCTHENTWTSESAAERDQYLHEGETGHTVAYAQVDDNGTDPSTLHVGDHVQDRDAEDDQRLLVVGLPGEHAGNYQINGDQTVADYNSEYPSNDPVVEAVYLSRTTTSLDTERAYAFPRSRLALDQPIHRRRDGDGEADQ